MGAPDFPARGIIASEGTARGMAAEVVRSGQVWAPQGIAPKIATLVFESRIRLPWTPEVVVTELGGHAEGSTVVYLPESGVLFSGDLVFRGRAAWVGGMRPEKWLAALRTMEGWDVETVIPGHGPIGGRDILTEQRLWLERLLVRGSPRVGGHTGAGCRRRRGRRHGGRRAGGDCRREASRGGPGRLRPSHPSHGGDRPESAASRPRYDRLGHAPRPGGRPPPSSRPPFRAIGTWPATSWAGPETPASP